MSDPITRCVATGAGVGEQVEASYQGEAYPFVTSTDIIPSYGLAAAPSVPVHLQGAVTAALARLNLTDPSIAAIGVSQFTSPASYDVPRQQTIALGLLYGPPGSRRRASPLQSLQSSRPLQSLQSSRP